MENENFFADSKTKVEEYIHEKVLLIKLQFVKKASKFFGALFFALLLLFFSFFILLFLSFMAAYFFASITHSFAIGFGIIALFYIILFIVFISMSKKIIDKPLTSLLVNIFFDKNEKENENE